MLFRRRWSGQKGDVNSTKSKLLTSSSNSLHAGGPTCGTGISVPGHSFSAKDAPWFNGLYLRQGTSAGQDRTVRPH